ncbi:MAG TPA: SAM-dependent methyltransferase, partial [Burkholderiaceae bacterium]|nr:SAM-dependent methyltransferase [Burkholderiaceae bacterium]
DRVRLFEGVNARELTAAQLADAMPADGFALIVIDVSFISLAQVLPAVSALRAPGGRLLALVKPQFEVGRAALDRRGIADPRAFEPMQARLRAALAACGWRVIDWFDSVLPGTDGNREFFVHAVAQRESAAAGC